MFSGPGNGNAEIYVKSTPLGAGDGEPPSISGDGAVVAFASQATNLTDDAGVQPVWNVYVHDFNDGTTKLVSNGLPGPTPVVDGGGWVPSVSNSGRYVAFTSGGINLDIDHPTDLRSNVYVRDMSRSDSVRVSEGGDEQVYVRRSSGGPVTDSGALTWVSRPCSACHPAGITFARKSSLGLDGKYLAFESNRSFTSATTDIVANTPFPPGRTSVIFRPDYS